MREAYAAGSTAAMLIGPGSLPPLAASGPSLIATTAPVAYGALGTPVILQELTTVDDLFRDGGVVLTTEAEAEACHRGTVLQRGLAGAKGS